MAQVTLEMLLEAGVHFGHQTRRWNPKMKKFIFTERNDIYIIDLQKTLTCLEKACNAVREISERGESILFVGTKPQASAIVREEAERCSQYHVTHRWAGGMLTNFRTIRQSIKRLDHIEKMASDGTYDHLTKKEVLLLEKQRERLLSVLGGIRKLNRPPGLLVVVDTRKEKIAINEAVRLGIPICAIVDTNSDPDAITYPIPGNDDAIRSIKLLLSSITDSVNEGMQLFVEKNSIEMKEKAAADAEKIEEEKKKSAHKPQVSEPSGAMAEKGPVTTADAVTDKKSTQSRPRTHDGERGKREDKRPAEKSREHREKPRPDRKPSEPTREPAKKIKQETKAKSDKNSE